MPDQRILVAVRVDPEVWARWKQFCFANRISVERGTESVVRAALERHGVPLIEERERRGPLEKVGG